MKNLQIIGILFIGTVLGILGTLFVANYEQIIGTEMIKFGKSIHKIEDMYESYEDLSFKPHSMDTTELVTYIDALDSLMLELTKSYEYFVDNTKNIKHILGYRSECLRVEHEIIRGRDRFLSVYNTIKIKEEMKRLNDIN